MSKYRPSKESSAFEDVDSDSSGEAKVKKFGAALSKDILEKVNSLLDTKLNQGHIRSKSKSKEAKASNPSDGAFLNVYLDKTKWGTQSN